jgi:hypothetical protein
VKARNSTPEAFAHELSEHEKLKKKYAEPGLRYQGRVQRREVGLEEVLGGDREPGTQQATITVVASERRC